MVKEQLQIVQHYMNQMDEYRLDDGKWWENLKKLKLKDKSETYIQEVSDLIDEWINYGKDAFFQKYGLS